MERLKKTARRACMWTKREFVNPCLWIVILCNARTFGSTHELGTCEERQICLSKLETQHGGGKKEPPNHTCREYKKPGRQQSSLRGARGHEAQKQTRSIGPPQEPMIPFVYFLFAVYPSAFRGGQLRERESERERG